MQEMGEKPRPGQKPVRAPVTYWWFQGSRPPKHLFFRLLVLGVVDLVSRASSVTPSSCSCSTKGPRGARRMIEDFSRPELLIFTVRKKKQHKAKKSPLEMPGNTCLLVLDFAQRKQKKKKNSPGRKEQRRSFKASHRWRSQTST